MRASNRLPVLLVFGLAALLAACSGRSAAAPPPPGDSGSGSVAQAASAPAKGHSTSAPMLPGKLLITGQTTLDLVSGGRKTSILSAPAPNSYFEYPAFSPDGKRIAYLLATTPTARGQDWGNDIYIANADGSQPKLVLKHDAPGALLDALSWSPDGQYLVFAYYRAVYDAKGQYTGQIARIERLRLADGKLTTLINNAAQPSLSWDGKQMVYLNFPQTEFEAPALMLANADGSQPHKLFADQKGFSALFSPHLSPNGKQVVFAGVGGPIGLTPAPPAPGRGATPTPSGGILGGLIQAFAGVGQAPVAQADGSPYQVWVANVDGTDLHTLGNLREDLPFPLWSADGKTILFLGAAGLYTANADGSNLKTIGPGVAHGEIAWYQK